MMQRQNLTISTRRFGRTDLNASQFGLGCARIGGIFKRDPGEFVKILSLAFDAGINFFDTANIYSQGESEMLLGRVFRRRRHQIIIATKAGYVLPPQRRLLARLKPFVRPAIRALGLSRHHVPDVVRGSLAQDFSPAHLRKSVDESLHRLQTDWLDLFQLHSPSLDVIQKTDWIEALEQLKQQGKIRYYGVSCDSFDATMAGLQHRTLSSIQIPINLLERDALRALPVAREHGVGVIARECLANGLLVKDMSATDIRSYCQSDVEAVNKASQLERYRQLAERSGSTLTQLALQFVNRLDGVSVTLVGVSRLQQLEALVSNGVPPPTLPEPGDVSRIA